MTTTHRSRLARDSVTQQDSACTLWIRDSGWSIKALFQLLPKHIELVFGHRETTAPEHPNECTSPNPVVLVRRDSASLQRERDYKVLLDCSVFSSMPGPNTRLPAHNPVGGFLCPPSERKLLLGRIAYPVIRGSGRVNGAGSSVRRCIATREFPRGPEPRGLWHLLVETLLRSKQIFLLSKGQMACLGKFQAAPRSR